MWEEWREVHTSSLGAVVAGLQAIDEQEIVEVPSWLIAKGRNALLNLLPMESATRPVDLAQLSLIYPYDVLSYPVASEIIERVEKQLLRERGVARYHGDSYYSTLENEGREKDLSHYFGTEAEWSFGLPWLALCQLHLGNPEKAKEYIEWTESIMLGDGSLPELYFAGQNKYNGNTPLGWANSMYILAKEAYLETMNNEQLTLF